jgi:hypothetical protein
MASGAATISLTASGSQAGTAATQLDRIEDLLELIFAKVYS